MTLAYGTETLELLQSLADGGVDRAVVVVRHAERHYDHEQPQNEAFMGLTDDGKNVSLAFGRKLPTDRLLRFYSSPVGRCVETAYQMEKGSLREGARTSVNQMHGHLMSFFLLRPFKAFAASKMMGGSEKFFRAWFDGELPSDVMMNAEEAHRSFCAVLSGMLDEPKEPHLTVCVSHDWNLYLLRELGLGQSQEEHGPAEYLEGVAVFRRGDELIIKNHRGPERAV